MARHGRYTILGKLADGGMAEIFSAVQHGAEGFQKPVVLKRILTQFSADPQFRNMLLDEGHISMTLQHSNIVQVLDLGVAGNRTFLVMELVDGWDLERILQRAYAANMAWPPALALYVTTVVCRALAYAHGKTRDGRPLGIVHRDISPNNVLISEQGEVKLADFGIAKAQQKREITAAGVIKGKVAYMSPEQALGVGIDKRSDIFSVGSLLYRMMTERLPFEGATDLEQLLKVQKGEFAAPETVKASVSAPVSTIIMRAMRPSPGDRYQTADEMLIDLERVLRNDFQSAGQTELKLWLEQLGRRDHVESNGKKRIDTSGIIKDELGTDLSAGTSFELDEVSGTAVGMTEIAATGPGGRLTPPPVPVEGAPASPSSPRTTIDRATGGRAGTPGPVSPPPAAVTGSIGKPRRRLAGFWFGAFFALAAVVGGRYLIAWVEEQGVAKKLGLGDDGAAGALEGPPKPVVVPAPTPPPEPKKVVTAPVVDARAAVVEAPAKEAVAANVPAAAADAAVAKPDAVAADTVVAAKKEEDDDDDQEEEELLKKAVPNAEQAVIGADGAEPEKAAEPPKREPTSETKGGAKAAAKAKAPPKPATAILHITTTPVGAVVRTKGQVLGRSPINLHFRAGLTYELTFVKAGFEPVSRRVAVIGTKDRKVAVALKKKKPAPAARKRSFFTPHR
ncbi:MAG TPA: protein kinase [Polyangia bacterium]|nr:protein kinase [Polyangia bacterium]